MIKSEKFSYIFKRLKDSILYFGAGVLALPISVFTSPLFAKNMSSYDFAAIGYFTALMQMILPILNLSFYSYFITDYFKRDEAENKKVLVSLVSFLILSNIVFIVIGYSGLYLYLNFSESSFSA
ncbi:MAG: hypothetical protein HYV28_19455, partial [Ignavibacteriales bacterium]|nr:hypothetical protein [Ignavibacteriales bacterium]